MSDFYLILGVSKDAGSSEIRRVSLGKGRDEWPWDEIVVDFLSMAAVIGRMRKSFFGVAADESCSTHRAEIELTVRQADHGARVPLNLLVRQTCPVCGGRGEVWTEACAVCAGTGAGLLPHQLQLRVPPGVSHGTRVRFSVTPPYASETHVEVRIAIH